MSFTIPHTSRPSYRVRLLDDVEVDACGLVYRSGEQARVLDWDRVERAIAAEVGEPEGVRTIVFDLVVHADADGYEVCRFDADPCDEAMAVARAIQGAIGPDRSCPSIKSMATDGIATRWYPDLGSLEEGALEELSQNR